LFYKDKLTDANTLENLNVMALANANDVVVSSGIEHCSLGSQSMNMSVEQHLSGCCDNNYIS
jgi:hypothetical protein